MTFVIDGLTYAIRPSSVEDRDQVARVLHEGFETCTPLVLGDRLGASTLAPPPPGQQRHHAGGKAERQPDDEVANLGGGLSALHA